MGDEGYRLAHENRAEHQEVNIRLYLSSTTFRFKKLKELLKKLETTLVSDPDYRMIMDTAKDFLLYHIAG